MDQLLDINTAAERLGGVSPWTVRSWLSQGLLQRTKVGRRTMVSESALETFLSNSNRQRDQGSQRNKKSK
jgi:excisionase family DNA binding protein